MLRIQCDLRRLDLWDQLGQRYAVPQTHPDTALPPQAGLSISLLFHLNPPFFRSLTVPGRASSTGGGLHLQVLNLKNRTIAIRARRWVRGRVKGPCLPPCWGDYWFSSCVFWVPKHSSKHITGVKYHLPWLFTNQELKVMEGRKGDIWTQERVPGFFQSWAPQNKPRAWGFMFHTTSV